jgi:uncharacterized damage-inducible protein DinB
MTDNILVKLFEHNHWANLQIIQACSDLSEEQLDEAPKSATMGSLRQTLLHLVSAQQGYLRLLTLPVEERRLHPVNVEFKGLDKSARLSGEALIAMVRDWSSTSVKAQLETTDGFYVDAWAIMVQIINHATEHREQIKSMLSALEITPPEIDGWIFAESSGSLVPIDA